jgi:Tol biopolymer transport system component
LGYADPQGLHLELVETGETQNVPLLPGIDPSRANCEFGGWYPDSTRFIASVAIPGRPVGLWMVPIRGGTPEKIADVEDMVGGGKISPGGSLIVFGKHPSALGARELWLMGLHGESPHKILTAEDRPPFGEIAWSPSGKRIAYSLALPDGSLLVQSCDLSGANQTTILRDNALFALAWMRPGRLVYSRSTQRGAARAGDLWELRVGEDDGVPHGKPRRLTDWSGFSIYRFSATADGKRLAFLRSTHHATALVGDLDGNGNRLVNSHRLTIDENMNIPLAWTADSREVIFSSQRAATRQIYRQALGQGSRPYRITSSPGTNFYMAQLSPGGASLVVEGETTGSFEMGFYRVGLTGGAPRLLFHVDGLTQYWCANKAAGFCVLGRPDPGKNELAISSFDPLGGDPKDLLRIPIEPGTDAGVGLDYAWQISPDGSWIAIMKRRGNLIRLAPLGKNQARTITINGYSDLLDLSWAANSRSLFVSSLAPGGATLLHVDLDGNAEPVWQQARATSFRGFSSPDSRHLALASETLETNVWMIGN